MKLPSRRTLTILTILFLVVVATVWAFSYHTFEFKGGLGIRDSGFFSYPRYHAQLGELPLWKNGKHSFTVHGLPPDPLDFELQVIDASGADRAELMSLSTLVSVTITDSTGKQICTANGSLSDSKERGRGGWVLATSDSRASFWHPGCQQLPISRFKTYTAKVTILGADDHSPQKLLRATLRGGGNELP